MPKIRIHHGTTDLDVNIVTVDTRCVDIIVHDDLTVDMKVPIGMNQDMIDKSTEKWLQTIEDRLTYKKWYAGHYHIEKCTGKLEILYHNIHEL